MKVKRIGYHGIRTDEVERMTWFFRDVLGLEAAGEDETVTFTRLPTHRRDLVEVYSREHADERMIPKDVDVMIAFVVEDVERAHAGEILGDVVAHELVDRVDVLGAEGTFVGGGVFGDIVHAADEHGAAGHEEGHCLFLVAAHQADNGFVGIAGAVLSDPMVDLDGRHLFTLAHVSAGLLFAAGGGEERAVGFIKPGADIERVDALAVGGVG